METIPEQSAPSLEAIPNHEVGTPTLEKIRQWESIEEAQVKAGNERLRELSRQDSQDPRVKAEKTQIHDINQCIADDADDALKTMENIENPTRKEKKIMRRLKRLANLRTSYMERLRRCVIL